MRVQDTLGAGNDGHSGRLHDLTGLHFITHLIDDFGRWTDKNDAFVFATPGKLAVLRQKAVAGVNRLSAALFGHIDDAVDI